MRREHPLRVACLVLACLVLPAAALQAQVKPAEFGIDPIRGAAELSCDFRYPDKALDQVIQGGQVELVVTIKSAAGGVVYTLTDATYASPGSGSSDRSQHPIRMLQAPRPFRSSQDSGHREIQDYLLLLGIDGTAPPQHHDVELTFSAEGRRDERRLIRLFVGARAKGQYVDAKATTSQPRVTAGSETPLSLEIFNKFPDYPVTIRRIELSSNPRGLVATLKQDRSDVIPPGGSKRIELTVHGKRAWLHHLSPVESKANLNVDILYDDGYRFGIERTPQIELEFVLDANPVVVGLITIISLLAGGLAGAWLRIKLTPPEPGLSAWERVVTSLVLGAAIVSLIVLARVEVLAQATSFQIPLHKPASILLIAFIVALYNPADLLKYLREKFMPGHSVNAPDPAAARRDGQ